MRRRQAWKNDALPDCADNKNKSQTAESWTRGGRRSFLYREGFAAACELIYYLAADACKIKTPVFNLSIRLPGEREGAETRLPESARPEARIRERARVEFDGAGQRDGIIAATVDERTGQADEAMTIGNLPAIHGCGIKIEAEAASKDDAGIFSDDGENPPVKAEILTVNEPRALKAILKVVAQSSVKHGNTQLKAFQEIHAEFKLTAQN
ncbi:MAG: DUF4469 domain-containing protein [Treponema sp.]|jgi:hypothetical protein|nr:DUF4469 domain-containing protein [Treponema sp.]